MRNHTHTRDLDVQSLRDRLISQSVTPHGREGGAAAPTEHEITIATTPDA
jgi:hypothetical protein